MSRLAPWLSELIDLLNKGCLQSRFISQLKQSDNALPTGAELCLTLWPFISSLPSNVLSVRSKLPPEMVDARRFFDVLSDDERYYQGLYKKQCYLAGVEDQMLVDLTPAPGTSQLCSLMNQYCKHGTYADGILAIVTAELAATIFARHSLEYFESYFRSNPPSSDLVTLEEGLAWLRLHAKPQTRHAIWMKRTVDTLNVEPPNNLPNQVESLVRAIFAFWQCPEDMQLTETDLSHPMTQTGRVNVS